MLAGEERIIFVVGFAEAVAGVEGDAVAVDPRGERGLKALLKAILYERQDFAFLKGGQGSPVGGASSGVHEDEAAFEVGAVWGPFRCPM